MINNSYYKEPFQVKVNGKIKDPCKKSCYLENEINNITLVFRGEINSSENMFNDLNNIIEIDLSNFDTSKVTNMNSMFKGCTNLKKIVFGNIDTSSVVNMNSLFEKCQSLESIDLSNFNTSLVTTMSAMFSNCKAIKSIDASSFNTAKVENMFDLFGYCDQLVSVNVSSFDTSNVKVMQGMFFCCNNLKYLDLHNFKASSVDNIAYMFAYCSSLSYLNLNSFSIERELDSSSTFLNVVTSNLEYVIKDIFTINNFFGTLIPNCSETCSQEHKKFDAVKHKCVESCDLIRFEFDNVCYENCPNNTFKLFTNRNICSIDVPENFYLDLNDSIYKECYETCKKCGKEGDLENNNCDQCKDNYTFINESFINKKNCFQKCEYYYYFDMNKQYFCTENNSCPENFNKLVIKDNKCIRDCRSDKNNVYEFNNTCVEKCPNGTIYNDSTNICNVEKNFENPIVTTTFINKVFTENIKEITIIEEEKEIDTYNNLTDEKKIAIEDELLINLKEDIMNGRLDDIIKNVTKNKEDYVMKKDNIIYQITTSENQKNKTSYEISSIDLLDCETILKEKYDINKTLPLIILNIDIKSNYTLINLFQIQ